MENLVLAELANLTEERQIRVLYACELGARAWGASSKDTDFEVRFIYLHSTNWYLSIQDRKDTIETFTHTPNGEEIELIGWDIRKMLNLIAKSYPLAFECLQSPMIYTRETDFVIDINKLAPQYFNLRHSLSHYLGIARSILQQDLKATHPLLRKYLYAIRSLLAAIWIAEKQTIPPLEIEKLCYVIQEADILNLVRQLLAQKRNGQDNQTIEKNPELNAYLEKQIVAYEAFVPSLVRTDNVQIEPLNELFRKVIHNA
ncbi:MAG: nucleotidyltransferase domain-containing protein [Microscillaceae bacterium]|nr:nucleotidyltransferase domain-containing protein [Microscillaceae bacterium]MDW8461577.1 nucleotidyltransferase domain-containing protein [Cytophagales bacterium]